MYATGTDRCPVKHFKKYVSLRTDKACESKSPFSLAVMNVPDSRVWYKNQPLGVNTLSEFMNMMAQNAGLTGHLMNHSARITCLVYRATFILYMLPS